MSVLITGERPASQTEIAKLEQGIGVKLPASYREFVLKYDGAEPASNSFKISEDQSSGVQQFIPVAQITNERSYIENLASASFPIAWDGCGNYVVIEAESGIVSFWDHETGVLSLVAKNFEDFLEGLEPFDISTIDLKPNDVEMVWIDPDFLKNLNQ